MSVNPDTVTSGPTYDMDAPTAPPLDPASGLPVDGAVAAPDFGAVESPATEVEASDSTSVMADEKSVEDRLLEAGKPFTLSNGMEFELRPLKLREFLKLLKIVTRGGASVLGQIDLNFNDTDAFIADFLAVILFAVPEAEEEVVEFLSAVCKPTALTGDAKKDQEVLMQAYAYFENPELEDVVDILTLLVKTEGADLAALGKRVASMLTVAQKMGAVK